MFLGRTTTAAVRSLVLSCGCCACTSILVAFDIVATWCIVARNSCCDWRLRIQHQRSLHPISAGRRRATSVHGKLAAAGSSRVCFPLIGAEPLTAWSEFVVVGALFPGTTRTWQHLPMPRCHLLLLLRLQLPYRLVAPQHMQQPVATLLKAAATQQAAHRPEPPPVSLTVQASTVPPTPP